MESPDPEPARVPEFLFLGILAAAITLFATVWIPYEATAALVVGALALTGLLPIEDAFSGFSNPATITVGCMFIVSAALIRTGALEFLVRLLRDGSAKRLGRLILLLAIVVGIASAFLNNTPVVVMSVPVVLALSKEQGVRPSKLLLPVSYFAILGGTCTLIGTSTNLLVDGVWRSHGGAGFHIFEFLPLGFCYFLVGAAYILLFHRRLLPDRAPLTALLPEDRAATYVTELLVGAQTSLAGRVVQDVLPPDRPGIRLIEIVRREHVLFAAAALDKTIEAGDSLIVEGTPGEIASFIERHELKIATVVEDDRRVEVHAMDLSIVEAVVLPDSPFVGRTVATLGLNRLYGVKVMGVQRHGLQHRYHLRGMRLKGGDVLLLQADRRGLDALRETGAVMVVEQIRHLAVQRHRAPVAIAILAAVVAVSSFNLLPLHLLSVLAVGALLATRCLLPREAMAALDAPVLLLIASSIPLGLAMERCGLADSIAQGIVGGLGSLGPPAVLSGFYLVTSILTSLLSNNATAVLMTPLALGTASALNVDPHPFLLAVMFGASACFATPIGYQTNLIVMGPGGYTFGDYFRFGLPLNVLLWIVASFLIPWMWPIA